MMNWIWLGAVVAFGVLEAATAALVSIWFVGGAAVALLASFLGAALWLQIALFLAVSVGILAAVRPLIKRANAKTVPTNLDRVIGCTARVTEEIDNEAGTGAVYVEGKTWTARSADGTVLPAGSRVAAMPFPAGGFYLLSSDGCPIAHSEDFCFDPSRCKRFHSISV